MPHMHQSNRSFIHNQYLSAPGWISTCLNNVVQSKTTRSVNEDWLPLEIVCDGIEEDWAPDVYPVRRSSEGGACSVASPAIPCHTLPWPAMPYHTLPWPSCPRRVLMAPVLLVTTTRSTMARPLRCTLTKNQVQDQDQDQVQLQEQVHGLGYWSLP